MKRYLFKDFPYFTDSNPNAPSDPLNTDPIFDEPNQKSIGVSRRDFLKFMTAAGLTGIAGSTTSIFWRGTCVSAYADDGGNLSYIITVFKRWEIPLVVYNVTGGSNTPVSDAIINVHSWITDKDSGNLTTNADGYAILDARDYAQKENWDGTYDFSGSILMKKEGYRTYETGVSVFQSGKELDIATEPDTGQLYLQSATFNEWDIQYAKEVEFTRSPKNEETHTFFIKLVGANASNAQVSIVQDSGKNLGTKTPTHLEGNLYTVEFSNQYLKADTPQCLDAESPIRIEISLPSGTLSIATTMHVKNAAFNTARHNEQHQICVIDVFAATLPENGPASTNPSISTEGYTITIPDGVPAIGGHDVQLPIPMPFVSLTQDPSGLIMLQAEFTVSSSLYATGKQGIQNWEKSNPVNTYKSMKDQYQEYQNLRKSNYEKFLDGDKPQSSKFFGNFDFSITGNVGLFLKEITPENEERLKGLYPPDCKYLDGGVTGKVTFALDFTYTFQFIPPNFVPFFVQLGVHGDTSINFMVNLVSWYARGDDKFYTLGGNPDEVFTSNLDWKVFIELFASLGIGVSGIFSISIRGSFSITYNLTAYLHDPYQNKVINPETGTEAVVALANPRHRVTITVGLDFCAQALLFKFSMPMCYGDWVVADNWNTSSNDTLIGDFSNMAHNPAFYTSPSGYTISAPPSNLNAPSIFATQLVPVTTEELLNRAEFRQSGSTNIDPGNGSTILDPIFDPITGLGTTYNSHPALLQSIQGWENKSVVPVETVIYKDVFSNPRMKIITHPKGTFLIRILPVQLDDGSPRTRLTISKYDNTQQTWGQPTVIGSGAFEWAESRKDLYDYDFNVSVPNPFDPLTSFINGGIVRIVLVSGSRSQGLSSTVGETAANTVLTLVEVDENFNIVKVLSTKTFTDLPGSTYYMINNPFIDTYVAQIPLVPHLSNSGYSCVAGAFVRTATTPEALVDGPYTEGIVVYGDGVCDNGTRYFCNEFYPLFKGFRPTDEWYSDSFKKENISFAISPSVPSPGVPTFANMTAYWFFTYVDDGGIQKARAVMAHYDTSSFNTAPMGNRFKPLTFREQDFDNISGVQPWYSRIKHGPSSTSTVVFEERRLDGFLATGGTSEEPQLLRLAVDGFTIRQEEISLTNKYKLETFALSEDGNTLFYTATMEGDTPITYDAYGNEIPSEHLNKHEIRAMTCVKNSAGEYRFTAPYTLCNLQHPSDGLVCIEAQDSFCFISSSIKDLSKSLADIYYLTVPKILHATVTNFSSEHRLVCAGAKEPFNVKLRNDGNKIAGALDLEIFTSDGQIVDTVHLDLGSAAVTALAAPSDGFGVVPSGRITDDGSPNVSAVAEGGALIPTEERTFSFEWIVPDTWSGNINLQVRVKPQSVCLAKYNIDSMNNRIAALSDSSNAPLIIGEDDDETLLIQGGNISALADLITPVDSTVSIHTASAADMAESIDVQASSYSWKGKKDTPTKADTDSSKRLAATGDTLGPLAGVAGVAALAAAGIATYSSRRTQIEKEQKEDTE